MGFLSQNWLGDSKNQGNSATYDFGKGIYGSGAGIEDSALAGINSDIGGYQDQIKAGGLTPSLRNQFNMARGSVLDRSTQQRLGLRSNLAQRALQTPGGLSPQAQAELEAGGNENIGAGEFGATNDVNMAEAQMSQQSTQALLDRIASARKEVLGAGADRSQLGAGMTMGALKNMNDLRGYIFRMIG